MNNNVIQLFPPTGKSYPLTGLYLSASLVPPDHPDRPFVYTNYVTSLDARIAVLDPADGVRKVPHHIANPRDWRLFQELAARADLLISSGRYMRDLAAGEAQDILPVSPSSDFADLHQWRRQQGMPTQPDVAVVSESLDFPVPAELLAQGRRIFVFTGENSDPNARRRLAEAGLEIITVSSSTVRGDTLIGHLGQLGYRRIYSVAGPYVLRLLLAADAVDSLFLTTGYSLLGGSDASTLLEGEPLAQPVNFRLAWLYYDGATDGRPAQTLARYDRLT